MSITNNRHQHTVGQGLFHSATLHDKNEIRLRYVFDCGFMQKFRTQRIKEIDKYLKAVGPKTHLDLLFISHIHADHVNGLERLLDKNKGLQVETIVLPLVNTVDRLISFGRTATFDTAAAQDQFYVDFILDPVGALSRFGPKQIIFIESGNRDDGAPGSQGDLPPEGPEGGGDIGGKRRSEFGASWKLVGRAYVRQLGSNPREDPPASDSSNNNVIVVPDNVAFMTHTRVGNWLLAPFVDPTVDAGRTRFLNRLAEIKGLSRRSLNKWLSRTSNIRKLITDDLSDLAAAYTDVARDLNITSLCLFSGPAPSKSTSYDRGNFTKFGKFSHCSDGPDTKLGWLCTGDAALAAKTRCTAFLSHYGHLLSEVHTITMPHHGSDKNFNQDIMARIEPTFCIAMADKFSNWRHPGTNTIQSISSRGLFLHVVTSNIASEFHERATLI